MWFDHPEDIFDQERPVLPWDLGDLDDESLMTMFNEFTIWTNYVAFEVTKAIIAEAEVDSDLEVEEAKYILLNVGKGEAGVQRANKEKRVSPEIVELSNKALQRRAVRKLMETLFNNMERSTFVVSRELSRRIGLAPAQGRLNRTST